MEMCVYAEDLGEKENTLTAKHIIEKGVKLANVVHIKFAESVGRGDHINFT